MDEKAPETRFERYWVYRAVAPIYLVESFSTSDYYERTTLHVEVGATSEEVIIHHKDQD